MTSKRSSCPSVASRWLRHLPLACSVGPQFFLNAIWATWWDCDSHTRARGITARQVALRKTFLSLSVEAAGKNEDRTHLVRWAGGVWEPAGCLSRAAGPRGGMRRGGSEVARNASPGAFWSCNAQRFAFVFRLLCGPRAARSGQPHASLRRNTWRSRRGELSTYAALTTATQLGSRQKVRDGPLQRKRGKVSSWGLLDLVSFLIEQLQLIWGSLNMDGSLMRKKNKFDAILIENIRQ